MAPQPLHVFMSDLKTKPTHSRVEVFFKSVDEEEKRADCFAILNLVKKVTGDERRMWGPGMGGSGVSLTSTIAGAKGTDSTPDSLPE